MFDIATTVSRVANETYSHSRRIMPEQPWWNHLESSFHKFPDDFDLDLKTELLVESTAWGDYALRTSAAGLLGALSLPLSLRPAQLKRDQHLADFYKDKANQADPDQYFVPPLSNSIKVESGSPGLLAFKPDDGTCQQLSFDSPFEPVNPAMNKRYLGRRRNMRAQAQYWRHNKGPRPTICVIHGFMADPYWLNRLFFDLPAFYKEGYDILLFTLPHHGRRKALLSPFSGHGFFSGGIAHVNESFAHAIHDFRIFMDYLQQQGVENIGVTGISLGGYTTSLLASVEPRLKFAIPNVPVVSLADLMLEWTPMNLMIKAMLKLTGTTISEFRHRMAVHSALTYSPKLDKERIMIIAGAGDRLAPPKHARLLWDHWQRPHIHWFPGNHLLHLDRGKYLNEIHRFLKEIEFDKP